MAEFYVIPLLILFLLLLFFLKIMKIHSPSKDFQLPPGPKPWPIIRNILQIGNIPHVTLSKISQSYGPLISMRVGNQIMIVGSSREAAKEILKTHDKVLSGRHVPDASPTNKQELNYLTAGFSFKCNSHWKFLRILYKTELFSRKSMDIHEGLREQNISNMVEYLKSMDGKMVEIRQVIFSTVLNILSNMFMSRDFTKYDQLDEEDGGMNGLIRSYMEMCSSLNLADFYPIFEKFDLQGLNKKLMDVMEKFWAKWEPIVEERRESIKSNKVSSQQDFLDTLLGKSFSNDEINYMLLELFVGGTDTVTLTAEWVMAELLKNPECMTRARRELEKGIKGIPKHSHLEKLTYLQACVKESLRLHPPGPILHPHRAVETCQVMGYTIPKDAHMIVNVWAIGRDPRIWEDPLNFKSERFVNSGLDFKGNDFGFIPFGAGRRMCHALLMGSKLVPLVVASLIHSFDWSLPFGGNPTELDMTDKVIAKATLRKEKALVLIPTKING